MIHSSSRRVRAGVSTSSLAIGLLLAGSPAWAQSQPQTSTETPSRQVSPEDAATDNEIIVTGTRASLQSAINRKRNAATAVDSIVAEDIAQFPDKNVGEALQRVTGVSLTRDFGEGSQISIRGVEPDLNRVEINGMSVLANAGTGNRGANFQELASELVASIDVVKGFTADMTEGGVGGTVMVRTRKPLDLTKPLLVVTGSGQYLDTAGTASIRGNITAGKKFFDGRLGAIVNVTYNDIKTRGDFLRNTLWTRFGTTETNGVVTASGDYDNSPEKSYVDKAYASITRKQDCPVMVGANACLNQWNEYIPAIPRYGIWERRDKRISAQATVEYRVTDNLRTYVEYTLNNRDQHLTDYDFQFQSDAQHRINGITYGRNGVALASQYPTVVRPVVVDAQHNLTDFYFAPYANTPAAGAVANQGSAGAFRTTNRDFDYSLKSQYGQLGFNWKVNNIALEGFVATSKANNVDDTNFLQFLSSIPDIHLTLNPKNGAPTFATPAGFDFNDPVSLSAPARNAAGAIVPTTTLNSQYQPKETDATEDTAKLDFDWNTEGFFNKIEFGYQYRNSTTKRYAPNGFTTFAQGDTTRAPIYVQGAFVNYNINQTGVNSAPTYSYNVAGNATGAVTATQTATNAAILAYMQATNKMTPQTFFNGPNPGATIPKQWYSPDATRIGESGLFDTSLYNHDLVRRSVGRDASGKIVGEFDQAPDRDLRETVHAGYLQVSFGTDVLGMALRGNLGLRSIWTKVNAAGALTESIRTSSGATPGPGRVVVTTVKRDSFDSLPTFNLSLDITSKLVARFGYAKLLARPKVLDLIPSGTCTFNDYPEAGSDGVVDTCSVGNPALKPYRADSYDFNVSWYLNRDTLISAAFFYKKVGSYTLARQLVTGVDVFGDGNLINATIPINGAGANQKGVELSAQTAFTFLPAPFDGFGVQANYTYASASNVGLFDAFTGVELPFAGQSRDTYNLIVYYDKGPINARLAYNGRSPYLTGVGSGGGLANFRRGTGYLDGKITVDITPKLSVFAEGQNLTGEYETAYSTSEIRSNEIQYAGRRFFVGATARF